MTITTTDEPKFAGPPTKATVSLRVQFGLLVLELSGYAAMGDETTTVERHQYTKAGHNPVGRKEYDKITGETITSDQIVKLVQVGEKLVELTDDEIGEVTAGETVDRAQIAIEALVPLSSIEDRYFTRARYQLRASKLQVGKQKKPNVPGNKAFRLFCALLAERGHAALIRVPLRSSIARYAVITPDGMLRMLHFDDEVREQLDFPETELTDAEVAAGGMLLDSYPVCTPPLVNVAGDKLLAYVEAKAEGSLPAPAAAATDEASVVQPTDLMAVLEASVAAAKKPAKAKATKKAA